MQFLPTKNEKYVSALRGYMHKSILCRGVNAKRLETLRKIYLFDLCISKPAPKNTDALILCRNILTECSVELIKKGIFITVDILGDGIKRIDTKVFTALIGEMVAQTVKDGQRHITISITEKEIRITSKGKRLRGYPLRLIKKLGGRYLVLGNTNAVSIPAPCCKIYKDLENSDIKELLLDPISPIKVYLSATENRFFV